MVPIQKTALLPLEARQRHDAFDLASGWISPTKKPIPHYPYTTPSDIWKMVYDPASESYIFVRKS